MEHKHTIKLTLIALIALMVGSVNASPLVPYQIVDGNRIPKSLTGKPGNAEKGLAVAINRKQGNCLACHILPEIKQPFMGKIGPNLTGVANRYRESELRLQIVNNKLINPESLMPAFYRVAGLHMVHKDFVGIPILSAEQVEDVVSYLVTLTEE